MSLYKKLRQLHDNVRPRPSRTKQARRFTIEGLENRDLLTILFTPQHGAETANYGGGNLLGGVSPGVPVYTIFWGSYWGTSAGQTLKSEVENSINPIFYNSGFLDGLHQYGISYRAFVPSSGFVEVNNDSDPPNGFTYSDIQNVIGNSIDEGMPESNEGLYAVFTPPGISSSDPQDGAYHTSFDNLSYAWIGDVNSQGLNDYTRMMSHEFEEAMTDPNGDGWQVLPRNGGAGGGWNEICDNEAQNYTALINGYQVQPHWSQSNGAYAINDGNSQIVTDDNGNLIVDGDQLGTNYNDTVYVDLNSSFGVLITLNGQQFSFPIGEINHVTVNTGGGHNTVEVHNTSSIAPVTINGGGDDTVSIGNWYEGVQGIDGTVDVENVASYTDLTLDDTNNNFSSCSVMLNQFGVYGLAPVAITYNQNSLSALRILTGSAGDSFLVSNTPEDSDGELTVIENDSGFGSNYFNVHCTTGPLYLDGGASFQSVTVGTGLTDAIFGLVAVYNSSASGHSSLAIDDHLDPTAQTANLYPGELTGLGTLAPIDWVPSASISGGVTYLAIEGGSGGNTYYVHDNDNIYDGTYLVAGSGHNIVNVDATAGPLNINGGAGVNTVDVGAGHLPNIKATVTVDNSSPIGSTHLYIDDSLDTTGQTANLSNGELTGLGAAAPIFWIPTATDGGGVVDLAVWGGEGGNIFNVNDTSNLYGRTYLLAGTGSNAVNNVYVYGTTGALNIDGGPGFDSVDVGEGSLAKINGQVLVYNSYSVGSSDLYIDDHLDTSGETATLDDGELTGMGASAPIEWVPSASISGGVTFLVVEGGTGRNMFLVNNTSSLYYETYLSTGGGTVTNTVDVYATTGALVIGGSGTDTLAGPNVASAWDITSKNAGTVGNISFAGVANLIGGTANDTFNFSSGATVTGTVNGGGGSNTLNDSAYTAPVTVNLQSDTATGTGGFSKIATLVGGSSTANTLVGANATNTWNLTGTNAGNVAGVKFSAFPNLTGGTGMDIFKFSNGKNVTGAIKGGGGSDWLDYSSYTTPVTVNLQTGAATGVGTKVTNVHNVRGGQDGNTITGDSKGGILIGGAAPIRSPAAAAGAS